jgi:hypothetical protein
VFKLQKIARSRKKPPWLQKRLQLIFAKRTNKHELYIIFPLSVVWDISPLEVIKLSNFKVRAFVRVLKFENLTIERICFSYDQNVDPMELKFIFTPLRGEALPCHLMIVQEQSNHQRP